MSDHDNGLLPCKTNYSQRMNHVKTMAQTRQKTWKVRVGGEISAASFGNPLALEVLSTSVIP